ncbi:hypothetical protein BC629DRAFT_1438639 [Irpex lacteus]|nr:hypothetical protein BC629DRAFT_1438639 [Irpex lacteus]
MFASSLRTPVRNALRRHASSSSSKGVKNVKKPLLPPKKMRALVSLYHQAGDFITPESLDREIDYAFHDQRDILQAFSDRREKGYTELQLELSERRALPKLSSGVVERNVMDYQSSGISYDSSWSAKQEERARQLKAALYGTEPSDEVPLPGYEVLVEDHERIQKLLKAEKGE